MTSFYKMIFIYLFKGLTFFKKGELLFRINNSGKEFQIIMILLVVLNICSSNPKTYILNQKPNLDFINNSDKEQKNSS